MVVVQSEQEWWQDRENALWNAVVVGQRGYVSVDDQVDALMGVGPEDRVSTFTPV